MISDELKPCPLCGSTNITCFAEYDGDSYENEPIYRAVVACLGCHEEGCDPSYDEEPCFGIEAYFRKDHPLIRDCEDPSDCERELERHMAERWNRRAERTCHDTGARKVFFVCSECGEIYRKDYMRLWHHKPWSYCPNCGARIKEDA